MAEVVQNMKNQDFLTFLLILSHHIKIKLESSRPKPGRMEETPKVGQGPPWTVVPLEGERKRILK